MRLRAATFKQLHLNLVGSSAAPPTVAGFVVARNEFPTARRREHSVSFERSGGRTFVALRAFARDTEVPLLLDDLGASFIPEADARGKGLGAYVNWIAHGRLTIFGENQLIRFDANSFDRWDNLIRAGINLIHPSGLFARIAASHVTQWFANTTVPGLPRSGFHLTDLRLAYEFAGKRGFASFEINNAFDQRFDAVVEGLSIDSFLPRRRALASLRWRLW
jgi:hypothetical protein